MHLLTDRVSPKPTDDGAKQMTLWAHSTCTNAVQQFETLSIFSGGGGVCYSTKSNATRLLGGISLCRVQCFNSISQHASFIIFTQNDSHITCSRQQGQDSATCRCLNKENSVGNASVAPVTFVYPSYCNYYLNLQRFVQLVSYLRHETRRLIVQRCNKTTLGN